MQGSVFVSGSSSTSTIPEEGGSFATEILTIGPLLVTRRILYR